VAIILPVVLLSVWNLVSHIKGRIYENRVLRRIFEPGTQEGGGSRKLEKIT